jgi:hypothetical protein
VQRRAKEAACLAADPVSRVFAHGACAPAAVIDFHNPLFSTAMLSPQYLKKNGVVALFLSHVPVA